MTTEPTRGKILVVEDEARLVRLIRAILESQGFTVTVAPTGERALEAVALELPDLVLLDLRLPGGMDGFEICRRIREFSMVPVVMLTASAREEEKLEGFEAGADDYITKPFSLRELAARVRAALRRRAGADPARKDAVYRGQHLVADFDAVSVTVEGAPVRLTRREFELLRHLVENRNRVLSRDRLLEKVWGYERYVETRSVDVHVGRLRSKLGIVSRQIETVVGLGYRFVE